MIFEQQRKMEEEKQKGSSNSGTAVNSRIDSLENNGVAVKEVATDEQLSKSEKAFETEASVDHQPEANGLGPPSKRAKASTSGTS